MLLLKELDQSDDAKVKAYRLQVKARLYRFNYVSEKRLRCEMVITLTAGNVVTNVTGGEERSLGKNLRVGRGRLRADTGDDFYLVARLHSASRAYVRLVAYNACSVQLVFVIVFTLRLYASARRWQGHATPLAPLPNTSVAAHRSSPSPPASTILLQKFADLPRRQSLPSTPRHLAASGRASSGHRPEPRTGQTRPDL